MFKMCNACDGAYDSLDVRFTKMCDNDCEFCIEKNGLPSLGEPNIDAMVDSALNSGIKSMLILGGEPFLYPDKLREFVSRCRPHFDTVYITTSLPNKFHSHPFLCREIIEMIDGLNISIFSCDDDVNNRIFKASCPHPRIKVLESLLDEGYSDKIRVCIDLIKDVNDSWLELFQTLLYLEKIGCKSVKINELQHSPLFVSFESVLTPDPIKTKSPYSGRCCVELEDIITTNLAEYDVAAYIHKKMLEGLDMNIIVKRSCFIVEESLDPSIKDIVKLAYKSFLWRPKNKFAVLYEDGHISNGWSINDNCTE